MAYADIPAANKPAFDAFALQVRATAIAHARFTAQLQRLALAYGGADVTAGLASLASTDTIDTPTGLAGTGVMTKAVLTAQLGDWNTINTTYGTNAKTTVLITLAGLPNVS